MKICVIVTNYNGYNYLSVYLEKIRSQCDKNKIPLFIADNQSSDASISYLEENNYVYTVNKKSGQGFAGNVNNGIRYAQSIGSFDCFIIASNDIEIGEFFFDILKKVLSLLEKKDPALGLIGFDEILPEREAYFRNFQYTLYNEESVSPMSVIPGFIFGIKEQVISRIGYLDEEYFMYGEDNDYFTRTRKAGFTIYNTLIPVLHFSEGSSTNQKRTSWLVYRNAFLYAQKNLNVFETLRLFASIVNQIYNPFHKTLNASHSRIKRNGFFYNNYLLIKSIVWNLRYYFRKRMRLS